MAEDIGLFLAQDVLKQLLRYAANEAGLALSFKRELEKLQKRSEMVAAFLSDAESRPSFSPDVQLWLKNLKAVVTDVDAVLDEFHYELLRRKLEVRGRFTKKVTDFFSSSNNPIAFRLKLAHNIKDINTRLNAINKEARESGLVQKVNTSASQPLPKLPQSSRGFDEKNVVGRDGDVSVIVDKLLELSDTKELPVISIWGMGGQGKTTLAKLVFKNDRVVSRFNKQSWVCVSTNFDVTRLLNEMLESLTASNSNMSNMDGMVRSLNNQLAGKRYLLILDDVWNENQVEWKWVRDALLGIGGRKGSAIIVTCRDKKVASAMDSSYIHSLSILSPVDSWTLFKNKAFVDGGALETQNLVEIGKEIVSRCGGVPLALDVLGSLLYSKKTEGEWEKVVDCLDKELINIQAILKLSYDHLSPLSLKSCFALFSIIEKDSFLDKDFLIRLWAALGLLPPPENSKKVLEDVGDEYLDLLVEKSLLEGKDARTFSGDEGFKKLVHDLTGHQVSRGVGYRMHDLVHDLALQVSKGYCFTVNGSNEVSSIPKDVTHLNFLSQKIETIELANGCFRTLQTLILAGSLPENVASKLKLLRVLVLKGKLVKELPPSIGNLKHLRLLDVSNTSIRKLPSSITKLYHLQTLNVHSLDEIPKGFGKLVNLRHFCFYKTVILIGVGKLTSLQTLPSFLVCRDKNCHVRELGELRNLKGKLEIHGLDDVKDEEEARSAKLVDKSRIDALEFYWEESNREEVEEDNEKEEKEESYRGEAVLEGLKEEDGESYRGEAVLEGLRPHSCLKSLSINNFKGVKFPSWMISASDSAIKNLVELKLVGCDRCEQVPTLGHLPNLKKVVMKGLKKVKKIGQEFYCGKEEGDHHVQYFPALKELVLKDMEMLEEWVDVKQLQVLPSSSSSSFPLLQFRNLEKLKIIECWNLKGVPSGPFPSLKKLTLVGVDRRMEVQRMSSWELSCLTCLELGGIGCEGLERVIEEWLKNNTTSLTEVNIYRCNTLVELQPRSSLFTDCVALKELRIFNCSKLKVIPDLGGGGGREEEGIEGLMITGCPELECCPRGIETLTSLLTLTIDGGIHHEIPRMPSSLRSLRLIGSWGNVKQLPQQQLGHLSALWKLTLNDMEGLEALPEWLPNLNNLTDLSIMYCKNLKEMPTPEATRHVRSLNIYNCSEILKERCVKGRGTDWPRIQHIPHIEIDEETIQDITSSSSD